MNSLKKAKILIIFEFQEEATAAGMQDYVTKPVRFDTLQQVLGQYLKDPVPQGPNDGDPTTTTTTITKPTNPTATTTENV